MYEPSETERQLYKYWFNCIKRAKKTQPVKDWDAADARLKCEKDKGTGEEGRGDIAKPYVNGFRLNYESLKSFLDQTEPNFKVMPSEPFFNNEEIQKQAECDSAYLRYIWSEQKLQVVQSQKLDSTLRKNFGATCLIFDKKKWMPGLKYLPAENILVDPDCNGVLQHASWMGYYEDVSLEEFKAANPNVSEEEIKSISEYSGSLLTENDKKEAEDPERDRMFTLVRVYHIFARNEAAIRTPKEGEDNPLPAKSLLDEMHLKTHRRYLQFAKGLHRPLKDDDWPYDLDEDEFPVSILRFNTPTESIYGFTDYQQMQRLDQMCDNIMFDIELDANWEAMRKFTSGPLAGDVTPEKVRDFLMNPKESYLPDMMGPDGKPKIVEVPVGIAKPDLANKYEIASRARERASTLGELLSQEAREYKDVTAIAARIHDANVHQRVNRRLGGPEGYEASIGEDAVKILELAHQLVPRYSVLEMPIPERAVGGEGEIYETGKEILDYVSLPWEQASRALSQPNTKLIQLGVDAIVGPELAQYWRTTSEYSTKIFKLSTRVMVIPGSTRAITKEHKAAVLKQYLLEVFLPLYQATNRWDLFAQFAERIGQMAGIEHVEQLLPKGDEMQKFSQQQQQLQEATQIKEAVQGQM